MPQNRMIWGIRVVQDPANGLSITMSDHQKWLSLEHHEVPCRK